MFVNQQILRLLENHVHRTFFDMLQCHQIPECRVNIIRDVSGVIVAKFHGSECRSRGLYEDHS